MLSPSDARFPDDISDAEMAAGFSLAVIADPDSTAEAPLPNIRAVICSLDSANRIVKCAIQGDAASGPARVVLYIHQRLGRLPAENAQCTARWVAVFDACTSAAEAIAAARRRSTTPDPRVPLC